MTNSADPDQLASSLFSKAGYPGSAGQGLSMDRIDKLIYTTESSCHILTGINRRSREVNL